MANVDESSDLELLVQSRALGDPTRHAIFVHLRDAAEPVTVSELAAHFGLNHNAIRQHLAKLLGAGLATEHRDPPSGPGRPPVRYRTVPGAAERWGAPGAYETLTTMLLEMLRTGATPREVGRATGRRMAEEHGVDADTSAVIEVVARRLGFEPRREATPDGTDVVLARCPFVGPATGTPEVVCALHRGLAEGIAEVAADGSTILDLVVRPPEIAGCRIRVRDSATAQAPSAAIAESARSSRNSAEVRGSASGESIERA